GRVGGCVEELVRLPNAEVLKEDAAQLVVVILAGMNQEVIHVPVQCCDHTRKPYDLRASADDGKNLHAETSSGTPGADTTGRQYVSGRSGSNISLAQNRVTSSPRPTFSMECVYPGGISITSMSPPLTWYWTTSQPSICRIRIRASPSSTKNFSVF